VPLSVTVLNTPLQTGEYLDANMGLYAQDSWRLNRLTINLGLRYDYLKQHVLGEPAQTGRFENSVAYGDIYLPTWNDWSPRTSVVYDLFGNGKTAIRAGFNKYMTGATTGFAQIYNPTALTTTSLPWTDSNHDDIAQGERGCVYLTTGCEINFASLPANFGVRSLSTFAPDLKRPYQYMYNVGIQHELVPGTSITAEYFYSSFKNLIERNNVARTAADYTLINVANPIDGSVIPYYNVSTAKVAAVNNVDSNDPNLTRTYNGVELNFSTRLAHGVRVFGGMSTERTVSNSCSAASTDPNLLLYCDGSKNNLPWITSGKVAGTVPLPWYGINFSVALQLLAGSSIGTLPVQYGVFTAGTGFTQPNGLGSNELISRTTNYAANCKGACTPGAPMIPGLTAGIASVNLGLVAPGIEFTPRVNELDLGVSKNFKVSNWSFTPKLDIFNALNSDDYTAVTSSQYNAATYLQPSVILQGRIVRVGVDVKW